MENTVPFLSAYLGHEGILETQKYLRASYILYVQSHRRISAYTDGMFPEVDFEWEKTLPPEKVDFENLSGGTVIRFLNWLETSRGCGVRTRNQRRAAIASFAKYAVKRAFNESIAFSSEVIDIPKKKTPKDNAIKYFTKEEVTILLKLPDTKKRLDSRTPSFWVCFIQAARGLRNFAIWPWTISRLGNRQSFVFSVRVVKDALSLSRTTALIFLKNISKAEVSALLKANPD